MSGYMEELESLRAQVTSLSLRNDKLEEECDLLASANHRLTAELTTLRSMTPSNATSKVQCEKDKEDAVVFTEGAGDYARTQSCQMLKSNGGMNVLCVCFACAGNDEIVISGGADKSIRLFSRSGGELSYIFASAPVLSLDSHLSMVAFSCMDGSHGIFDTSDTKHVVTLQETHSKYVVCVRWSCSGAFLATASYDKTVNVYAVSFPECTLLKTLHLNDSPESLAFTVVDDTDELIIGVRDTAYLLYFNCNSLKESRVSLNEHDWDTHCSFTPLCLSVSPDRSLLLVASDKHMHYIYRICTNIRLVTLAGHTCSEYGRPRCVFDRSGKYVYTNSEQDSHVHVYSIASKRIVFSMHGHSGLVKDVATSIRSGEVLSCSFDKSVILWSPI